jgi:hypothetical protein
MQVAKIDSTSAETTIIAFNNGKYNITFPGIFFIQERLGGNYCGCITNYFTGKYNDYRVSRTPCTEAHQGFCEFKLPRGKTDLNFRSNFNTIIFNSYINSSLDL